MEENPQASPHSRARPHAHAHSDEHIPEKKGLEVAIFLVMAAGIVFFGGVHDAFIASQLLALLTLGGMYVVSSLGREKLVLPVSPLGIGFLVFVLYGHLQVLTGITITPEQTRETLLRYESATVVFLLTAAVARTRGSVERGIMGVAILMGLEALYGLAEHYSGSEHILAWQKVFTGNVTGTYVNKNHFAGFLALTTPPVLGLALAHRITWDPEAPTLRTKLALAVDDPAFWRRACFFVAAALGTLTTFLSLSRGGALAVVFGLACFGILAARKPQHRAAAGAALVGLVLLSLVGVWRYGTDAVLGRFSRISQETDLGHADSRLSFMKGTIKLIAERPLAGAGLGSFEQNYTHVQAGWLGGSILDHAHSDWLEIPSEVGIPVFLVLVGLGVVTFVQAVRKSGTERGSVLFAGLLAGILAGAAHSVVDFNMQLGGTLVLAAYLAGLALGRYGETVTLRGSRAFGAGVGFLIVLALPVPYANRVLRAELLAHPMVRAEDDDRTPAEKVAGLERAIELRPEKTRYRLQVIEPRMEEFDRNVDRDAQAAARNLVGGAPRESLVGSLRVAERWDREETFERLWQKSVEDMQIASRLEPRNANVHAKLALLTRNRDEAFRASEEAVRYFPNGADVLVEAAEGRLRFDGTDKEALVWLKEGLRLDQGLTSEPLELSLALGFSEQLSKVLPSMEAHRKLAVLAANRGKLDALGRELDVLTRMEEGRVPPAQVTSASLTGSAQGLTIEPGRWRDAPNGKALEKFDAKFVKLSWGRHAFAEVRQAGTLVIEWSVGPEQPPTHVCVLYVGKHLGHALVGEKTSRAAFRIQSPGWIELRIALEGHGLRDGANAAGDVIVRDVVFMPTGS